MRVVFGYGFYFEVHNSLVTKTQWTLCDKEQCIKFFAMTVTFHTLAKQNAAFPSAKRNTLTDIRHQRFSKSELTKYAFDNEHSMDGPTLKF